MFEFRLDIKRIRDFSCREAGRNELDNQMYVVPYDLEKLNQVTKRSGLTELAECKDWAPYLRNFVKYVRWSDDMSRLAMVIMGVGGDLVTIIDITTCTPEPETLDNFLPPRFRTEDYTAAPNIPNFGWDGSSLYSMATYVRNNGFGNLHVYNGDLYKASTYVNPINETCCYRDTNIGEDLRFVRDCAEELSWMPHSDEDIIATITPHVMSVKTNAAE